MVHVLFLLNEFESERKRYMLLTDLLFMCERKDSNYKVDKEYIYHT